MQHALLTALFSGLVVPAIGMYIVQRHLSLPGDGLGHVVVMGVGLALLTGTAPLSIAVVTCVAGSVTVELLRQSGKTSDDLGLAMLLYGGIVSGVMMAGTTGQGPAGLSAYLFGALTSVSKSDFWVIAALAVVVLVFSLGSLPRLFAVRADEDFARVLGIRVKLLNLLVIVITSVTVTLSMRTVGLLLISALMVIPVAASQQLFTGFRTTLLGAMGIGVLAALGGTFGSYHWNTVTGATIVMVAIALSGIAILMGTFLAPSPRLIPFVSPHGKRNVLPPRGPPGQDPRSGDIVSIQHGDHLDRVVGNRHHALHGDHYDEH